MSRKLWWTIGVVAVVAVVVLFLVFGNVFPRGGTPAATGSSAPGTTSAPSPTAVPTTAAPTTAAAPSVDPAQALAALKLASMSLEQKVGQVLMVSSPVTGASTESLYAVDKLPVGNVFMKGRSTAGTDGIAAVVKDITGHINGDRTEGVLPFVSTDQEGGLVQIMRGPGFADMPQAIEQGQVAPATLEANATQWGRELAAVGVNVNLAPVLDVVPSAEFAPQNAPIGAFGREYGYTPQTVSMHGLAFAQGMLSAGINPTVKHFPGLGRVTANTDVAAGVTDNVTVRNDPFIAPFRDAVNAGVPWLMVSNAFYPKIDPTNLAPFSTVIVNDMVRGDLGFKGIIVSDDICDAVQVSAVPVADRGVDFIEAGGTMALCTNESLMPAMYQGLLAGAQKDPALAKQVTAAALLVLEAKAVNGLIVK